MRDLAYDVSISHTTHCTVHFGVLVLALRLFFWADARKDGGLTATANVCAYRVRERVHVHVLLALWSNTSHLGVARWRWMRVRA